MNSNPLKELEVALGLNKDTEVTFLDFLTKPEFLNMGEEVYDFWKEETDFRTEDGEIDYPEELVITGSLGGGKSFVSSLYMCYRLYLILKEPEPLRVLGLSLGSNVSILYFSVSMTAAEKTGFHYLKQGIDRCAWFRNNCPRNTRLKSSIEFENVPFSIDYASASGHALGQNVWGFILDEANFREGVGSGTSEQYDEVYTLCQQLMDRQLSRFESNGKFSPLACFVSSASFQSAFIEKRIELAKDTPKTRVIRAVTYKIRQDRYSKETFEVFTGYGQIEPCIINNSAQRLAILSHADLPEENSEHLFQHPPVDLLKSFQSDIHLAIQNHCGVSTMVKGTFFRNVELLQKAYAKYYESKIWTPFKNSIITVSNQDDSTIEEWFDLDLLVDPDKPHALFLDLSVQGDSGGLSMVRYDGIINGQRHHTHVFTLEIVPPEYPAMTRIKKVTDFILWLTQYVNIAAFSSDQYQSTQVRQDVCAETGLDDIRTSLDSSDLPFIHWVKGLIDERFDMLFVEKTDTEIKEAEHDLKRRRIVKREKSTDDLFQSIVGAYFLSDTIVAALFEDMEQLIEGGRLNIVGGKAVSQVLKKCGYDKW